MPGIDNPQAMFRQACGAKRQTPSQTAQGRSGLFATGAVVL